MTEETMGDVVEAYKSACKGVEIKWGEVVLHASDWMKLGDAIQALSRPAPSEASGDVVEDKLDRDWTKRSVHEVMDEGDGFWRPCSGCQEGVDGYVSHKDYPYSDLFRCQPGAGCGECGGIGVTWDDTDYEEYAKFALELDEDKAPQANAWSPIETAPLNDQFIAAVEVRNNKTGQSWWEKHLVWIDDETGDVHSDCEQGWGLRDYIYWHPVPANPLTEGQTDAD